MRRPRPPAIILRLCVAAVVVLAARRASTAPEFQPSTTVVLFTPAVPDPLLARLEAELAAVGIQVRRVNVPPERQLEAAVLREIAGGASAAIRVLPRSRGADVWTPDPTARALRRQTTGAGTTDLSVIALQTVEFLRATLLGPADGPLVGRPGTSTAEGPPPEAQTATAPGAADETRTAGHEPRPDTSERPSAEPLAARPSRAPAEAPVKRERLPEWGLRAPAEAEDSVSESVDLEISVGPALMASPGDIPLVTSVAALVRAHLSAQAGVELMAVFPVAAARLPSNPEGTVAIKTALFGGAIVFRLPTPRRVRADVAFGASAFILRATGTGSGGAGTDPTASANVGSVETVWKVAGNARLGGGVELNRWLSLRADLLGGLTGRTAVGYDVTTAGGQTVMTDRGSWGPVFAVATAGLQIGW